MKKRKKKSIITIVIIIVCLLILGIFLFSGKKVHSKNSPSQQEQCNNTGGIWCNNKCFQKCQLGEQSFCNPSGEFECVPLPNSNNTFNSYDNTEPYYSLYCDKIDPFNLEVREAAAEAIRNDSGAYNINQLLDIYDWVKDNIQYQSVPLEGIPYKPSDTLITKSGDCKNQAVLIASMVEAIGGSAKVVIDPTCSHAYALVYISNKSEDMNWVNDDINTHYGQQLNVQFTTSNEEYWLIFDPAGGFYPGNTLAECSGGREVYYVNTCLTCVNQYPNMPYTFRDKCYSQCPSGTISTNNYACSTCPEGDYSYNNQCVSCPDGYVLAINGRCYKKQKSPLF